MIEEFDKVKIKSNGKTGIVVDIGKANNKAVYAVELDEKTDDGWEIVFTYLAEIEKTEYDD